MKFIHSNAKKVFQLLVRKRSPLVFGDLLRTDPVSNRFGMERGMPIDRHYIHSFVAANADAISGRAIEVGELRYLREFGACVVEECILAPNEDVAKSVPSGSRKVIGDLTVPATLPENYFDCFVCTQTINFIYDFKAAIRGAYHLLAPGGVFLGTVSGISQISRYDMDRWGDYWRFTDLSLNRALGEVFGAKINLESFGNALAAQALLQGISVEDLPDGSLLDVHDKDYQVIIGFRVRKEL